MDLLSDLLGEAKDKGILKEKVVENLASNRHVARRVISADNLSKKNVAIVLIINEIACENCGETFSSPNSYPHVRQIFPSGMTQVTPFAMTEMISHLPRETMVRKESVPVCMHCLDKIGEAELKKSSEFRIRENYGVHKHGDSLTKAEHNNRLSDATFEVPTLEIED